MMEAAAMGGGLAEMMPFVGAGARAGAMLGPYGAAAGAIAGAVAGAAGLATAAEAVFHHATAGHQNPAAAAAQSLSHAMDP